MVQRSKHSSRSDEMLRLWLRLLKCSNLIESQIRSRLRAKFDSTLPRFDLLAQLHAAENDNQPGLLMGDLSRRLMVTNGNLTGLTERLVKERLVTRSVSTRDRRSQRISLTASGRRALKKMAAEHRQWIEEMLAPLSRNDMESLSRLLKRLRESVQTALPSQHETRDAAGGSND